MIVENRIKSVIVWVTSIMFFIILSIEFIHNHTKLNDWFILVDLLLNLFLFLTGIIILLSKKRLTEWTSVFLHAFEWYLATEIVYYTNGINSDYFPIIYIVLIAYSGFNRGSKIFIWTTVLGFSSIVVWTFLFNQMSVLVDIENIMLLLIFGVFTLIIRNYRIECLACKSITTSCPMTKSCVFIINNQKHLGDEYNVKLYKEG